MIFLQNRVQKLCHHFPLYNTLGTIQRNIWHATKQKSINSSIHIEKMQKFQNTLLPNKLQLCPSFFVNSIFPLCIVIVHYRQTIIHFIPIQVSLHTMAIVGIVICCHNISLSYYFVTKSNTIFFPNHPLPRQILLACIDCQKIGFRAQIYHKQDRPGQWMIWIKIYVANQKLAWK